MIAKQTYKSDDNDADRDKNVSNVGSYDCLGRINQTLRWSWFIFSRERFIKAFVKNNDYKSTNFIKKIQHQPLGANLINLRLFWRQSREGWSCSASRSPSWSPRLPANPCGREWTWPSACWSGPSQSPGRWTRARQASSSGLVSKSRTES